MRKTLAWTVALLIGTLLLPACSPTLNWRDVQLDTGLRALLPCKPDQTQQTQTLAGRKLQVQMLGCEAGDALWALASADLGPDAAQNYAEVQQAWQAGLARALQSVEPAEKQPYLIAAEPGEPGSAVTLRGHSSSGQPLEARALWLLRGQRIHVAVVYAEHITPEMVETFWESVRSH